VWSELCWFCQRSFIESITGGRAVVVTKGSSETKLEGQVNEQASQGLKPNDDLPDPLADQSSALPLVSVIVAAYNAEEFIGRTLESVLAQTYQNIEVLVVDDGSIDRTLEIVNHYAARDSRLKPLSESHLGICEARNKGIAASNGEFVAPIDADDVWHKDKLKEQVKCILREGPNVGLVYSWSVMIDEHDAPILGMAHDCDGDVFLNLIYSNFVGSGSAALIRRSCLDRVGGFDAQLPACIDWDVYLRIAEQYEFRVVPKFHIGYRRVPGSHSADYERMERGFKLLMKKLTQRRPDVPRPMVRLSESYFCLYLTGKTNEKRHYRRTFALLTRSLRRDATLLLSSEFLRISVKSGLRMIADPIVSRIWENGHAWGKLKRNLKLFLSHEPLAQAEAGPWAIEYRRKTRLHDRIKDYRLARFGEQIRMLKRQR
jgi:glycosyltransferase involved in cell wall biosynthesis